MRYLAVFGVVLALLLLAAPTQGQEEVAILATEDGVTLSLLVPGTTFPRDALIPVRVIAHNDT